MKLQFSSAVKVAFHTQWIGRGNQQNRSPQ